MARFFGLLGSQNGINVLHKSHMLEDPKHGRLPNVNFIIHDNNYSHGYYLADGIYPRWSTFSSVQDYVERAFVILKKKFAIICGSYRGLDSHEMHKTMHTCIIMHNMVIVETRRDKRWVNYEDEYLSHDIQPGHGIPARNYAAITNHIRNTTLYQWLRADLTANLWEEYGRSCAMD